MTTDELIKKIILNMTYDSRKTLNENRLILEECIPINTKLDNLVNGEYQKGTNRSNAYLELGKHGDGNCKCKNDNCLKYKKSCCGTGKVSVDQDGITQTLDKSENTFEQHTSIDGSVLSLPTKTQINYSNDKEWWSDNPEIFDIKDPSYPTVKSACSYLKDNDLLKDYGGFIDIPSCILGYLKSVKTKSNQAGNFVVSNFKLPNGTIYSSCYNIRSSEGGPPYRPHEIKFRGYFNKDGNTTGIDGNCGTNQYTPMTGEEILNKRLEGTNTYVNDAGPSSEIDYIITGDGTDGDYLNLPLSKGL